MRFEKSAIEALQEISESYITQYLNQAQSAAIHAKRQTITSEDLEHVKKFRAEMVNVISFNFVVY